MNTSGPPTIPPERGDDLHNLELAGRADLTLFMAGNQFMVMDDLLAAFSREHPEVESIFYETLPPGLELRQILAGGAIFRDGVIDAVPDIYSSVSEDAMLELAAAGLIEGGGQGAGSGSSAGTGNASGASAGAGYRAYLHNRIVLMVPRGNPAGIASVADLGREDVRISQPDPENENIASHIINMYRDAGGEELVARIMEEKRSAGATLMTRVHHRETPQWTQEGRADVGPVWATEIEHAVRNGAAIEMVDPGPGLDQRAKINYYICTLRNSPRPENARKFIEFLFSGPARGIYSSFGFEPEG